MNKIFKVIFSKAKGCYVVVSELAKSAGKGTSASHIQRGYTLTLAAAVLSMMMGMAPVGAAAPVNLDHGASAYYDAKGNLTIGDKQTVAEGKNQNGENNTTIGTQTDTLRNVKGDTEKEGQPLDDDSNTVLVDGEGKAHNLNLSTEAGGSTAVGYQSRAEGDYSTAIGNNAKITNKPVTYYVDADGKKTVSPENAVWYKDASGNPTKVPQVFRDADGKTTTTPQYVHTYTEKDPDTKEDVTKTEITSDATKADKKDGQPVYNYQKSDNTPYLYTVTLYQAASNSIAAGTSVTANGSNAVALGYSSSADNSAVAIGDTAEAKENAVAIGKNTKATAKGSIALGKGSEADRDGGVAGWDPKTGTASTKSDVAWKSGEGALSIGNGGASRQITNVAAGSEDSDAVNLAQLKNAMTHYYSVKTTSDTDADGNNNYLNDGATGNNALAAGVGATASSDDATAVGTYANATASQATAIGRSASASSYQDTAIGYNAGAHGTYATAVGSSASATSFQSTAIGYNAGAHGSYATALGNSANASSTNATALGASANAPYENSTAVGASAKATDNQATAIGSSAEATDTYATAVGNSASATSHESTAIGSGAGAHGDYAIAMGNGASATNSYAVAIGAGANAPSYQATALGNGASATSSQATAIGTGAGARGSYATALGNGASAYSSYATALGSSATAQSSDDTAIGSSAKASGGDATALGYNAQATAPNATALGSGASAYYHAIAIGAASASSSYALAAGDGANAQEYQAIALGYNAKSNVTGGVALGSGSTANVDSGKTGLDPHTGKASTATGAPWVSTLGALSVGTVDSDGTATGTRQINGVAAGTQDTDAVNVAQLKAMETRINMHYYSVNSTLSGDGSNYDNTGASGTNALAAGPMASASGENAVAIGYGARAEGKSATAIGKNASATGQYAMAFGGFDTTDKKGNPVTMTNTASGASATAFGQGAQAKGNASLAFGHNTVAGVDGGSGQQSVAFGEDTQALGGRSLAFGEKTIAKYNDSVAFGNDTRASSTGATAFGNRTRALSLYSTAWGNATVAADEESTAWGTDTIAGAKLDANGAVTNIYTYKNNPDDKNEQAKTATEQMDVHGNLAYIQPNGKTAGIKQMPIDSGTEKHDYVVLAGKDGNTYVRDYQGSLWKVNVATDGTVTVDTTAGTNGKVYNGKNGAKQSLATTTVNGAEVAITPDNVLTKAHEGSNGYNIDGYANATAFGYSTEASGDNATAFGNDTKASAAGATAFGYQTVASGENATAFGENSIAAAKNSLAALGGSVSATATNAAAIGKNAQATLEDSVALGSGAVADRKSGAKGYDLLTKGDTTNTTAAWVSNANAIAVGNGSTLTRQITGVAAGSQDTDAVNVAQLKAAGFKVTTQNDGSISSSILNGDTLDFEAKDNAIVSTSKDSKTITVAVSKTPTFDSATFGTTNNEKVTIANGQVSAYNDQQQKRAVVGVDNQGNGTLFLVNDDLSQAHLYTQSSKETGNDGITRMYYTSSTDDNGGEVNGVHTIAVLDDGINYAGDNVKPNTSEKVVVKHKLNSTMDITGGADTNNLAEGNIGVVATPAVEDKQGNITQKAKLELKLNKDLTGLNTVTAGTAKIGSAPADTLKLTENGAVTEKTAPAGSYVTGLDNKDWSTTNPSYVSGRAATEDQLAAVSGTINKGLSFTTNTQDATNTTDNYTGYKVVNRKLGDTIAIKAGDADASRHYATTNLTTEIANNGDITIKMDESPTFNIVTATSVNLSPKDTTTKDQAGNTASARLDAHYRDASLNPDKNVKMADDSTGMVRLHYHDGEGTIHDLATMDDGQIYAGDIKTDGTPDTTGFGRRINEKTTINGGVTNKDNLTDNNIGVVSNGTNTLTVKLAKNLKDLQSVQTGRTTMDDKGLTIRKSDDDSSKNVIVLGDQVAFGNNQVNNMGSGASKITEDDKGNKTYEYNTLNNGANIGDVKNIASSTVQPVIDTVNKGWELDVNGTKQKAVTPDSPKVNLIQGQNITITGDKDNTDNVTIATANDVRFNTVRVGGSKTGDTYSGGIVIGKQSGGDSANPDENDYITGLENTNWDSTKIQHGRAATEDQLQAVATEIKNGTVKGDVFVTGGAVSYKGEGKGADPKDKDGTGSINLTRQNAIDVTIDGLHDYYVTGGTVTNDGKTLELTRNDVDGSGNPQKITVDLGNVAKNDLHLVANPATDSEGKYTVNTSTGTVTLKVQNGDGSTSQDITIGGFEGLGKGLKFGANKMAKDGGGNPVTNQLGSTINVTGAGTKNLQDYSGKNLLTSVEQAADGTTIIHVLMDRNISADGVTVGQAGTDGVAGKNGEVGQAGTIGINGKNGVKGDGDKEGITTTIIRTEKGQPGENGATGKPGVDGKDITRIVYQNDQDKVDGKDGSHTVATLDDGLKFSGDDNKVITKKLNEQLQFVGGADKSKLTENNIGINELEDGKLTIQLVNTPNLGENGNLTAGKAHIGWFAGDTLDMTKDGTNPSGNKAGAGSYATGLSNTDWNVSDPEYVSGRAATEDQLAKVSEAIGNATTAAGKRTVVTVNDKSNPAEATPSATVGAYGDYDSTGGNLMIAAKKDSEGVLTYNIKLNDQLAIGQKGEPGVAGKDGKDGKVTVETKGGTTVVIGHDGKDGDNGRDGLFVTGKDGADGVSITGPNGADGTDGKVGISGTDGKDAVSISGKDGVGHIGLTGPKGADGKNADIDISAVLGKATLDRSQNEVQGDDKDGAKDQASRIQYQTFVKEADGTPRTITHEVATMDDGMKFAGDDAHTTVAKKLNETLQIRGDGTYNEKNNTVADNGNIKTSVDNGAVKVSLSDKINLHQEGYLTVGGDKNGDAADGNDPILIKHFDAGDLTVTGTGKDGKTPQSKAGDYVTGLDNKDWDVDHPTYVSGRAATEDQLKEVSNAVTKATETAGKHTVVTVEGGKDAGTTDYNGENLKLKVTDTAGQKTYDLKLNDNLSLGTVGKDGEKGTDGSIGLKGADGKSSIGLNGKDGISVIGKDGKNGVSITGSNGLNGKDGIDGKIAIGTPGKDGQPGKDAVSISGQNGEGHIGLTGPAGKDGKDASADIHVKNGQVGVDGTDGNNGKDGMDRIVYDDHNGKPHEVATMDDGLKFVGNDDQEVTRKLNETLSIKGGLDKDAVAKASTKNLGVRQNATKDGLEIVMTDTPDFTKVTVGKGDDTTKKITIGEQPNTDTKNPANGNYITGLDNTKWDKDHVTENRAATEGQLSQAINDIKGTANGGFGLADENGGTVKKDLGQTVTVKGDGKNIQTKVKDGGLEISLNKDVNLGADGSVKAGNTTINKDGVDTNKVKVGGITITDQGINGGTKQITNIASGLDSTKHYADPIDNNAASNGDVKQLARNEAKASEARSGKNITVKDDHTVNLNDDITLGDDPNKQVAIHGSNGQVTIGTGDNAINLGKQANTAGDSNPKEGNYLNGLDNRNWDGVHIQNGRAATEDQLKTVSDKVKSGRVFQGDDGQNVTVGLGDTLKIQGGAKDVSSDNNIGIVKGADDTLQVRLAKDVTGLNSVTTGGTTMNGKGLTIKTGDANRTITVQDGNVNMGGNQIHHVALGQAPDDAVNVSQLNATNYAVNKLDTRVNRVGANAAALAALHPLDFDPDDKWDFSAGYGHYKDANAAAVGAFYRPNEDTMFSVGGSFGGGENMVNAGVSVKLGQGNHVSTSRVAMAKEIKDLKKDVADLKAVVNQQSALIDKLTGVNAGELSGSDDLFPDVPANHWAYEYVTRLKQAGILTGYPDGNFAGDRMMTRYEFAAIVYRAIMAGAAANPSLNKDGTLDRLAREFSSEMKYIRIDTIRKDRNGRPTIQRVRVIKEDENKA